MSDVDLLPHLLEIKGTLGELKGQFTGLEDHLASVSKKADGIREDFNLHAADLTAHGKAAVDAEQAKTKTTWERWAAAAGFAAGAAAFIAQAWSKIQAMLHPAGSLGK